MALERLGDPQDLFVGPHSSEELTGHGLFLTPVGIGAFQALNWRDQVEIQRFAASSPVATSLDYRFVRNESYPIGDSGNAFIGETFLLNPTRRSFDPQSLRFKVEGVESSAAALQAAGFGDLRGPAKVLQGSSLLMGAFSAYHDGPDSGEIVVKVREDGHEVTVKCNANPREIANRFDLFDDILDNIIVRLRLPRAGAEIASLRFPTKNQPVFEMRLLRPELDTRDFPFESRHLSDLWGFFERHRPSQEALVRTPGAAALAVPTISLVEGCAPLTRKSTVLITEPDQAWREEIETMLRDQGFGSFTFVEGFEEAAAAISSDMRIGLVVTNVKRPEGKWEGAEFARTLRAQHAGVKIIILTGYLHGRFVHYEDSDVWVVGKLHAHEDFPSVLGRLLND